jgi:hypothetical protein
VVSEFGAAGVLLDAPDYRASDNDSIRHGSDLANLNGGADAETDGQGKIRELPHPRD